MKTAVYHMPKIPPYATKRLSCPFPLDTDHPPSQFYLIYISFHPHLSTCPQLLSPSPGLVLSPSLALPDLVSSPPSHSLALSLPHLVSSPPSPGLVSSPSLALPHPISPSPGFVSSLSLALSPSTTLSSIHSPFSCLETALFHSQSHLSTALSRSHPRLDSAAWTPPSSTSSRTFTTQFLSFFSCPTLTPTSSINNER